MNKLLLSTLSVVALSTASTSFANSKYVGDAYYQIEDVKVSEVTELYPEFIPADQGSLTENCDQNNGGFVMSEPVTTNPPITNPGTPPPAPTKPPVTPQGDPTVVILDQIMNLGVRIWSIVEDGKPVVNTTAQTANALPKGLSCWADLQGWRVPTTKLYQIAYTNGFGMEVVKFVFRLTFTHGGNLSGMGQYITNATMMPAELNVGWGYTFNAQGAVPSVFNAGSVEAPLAGMQMVITWKVDTVLKHMEKSETFYLQGDGQLIHLD